MISWFYDAESERHVPYSKIGYDTITSDIVTEIILTDDERDKLSQSNEYGKIHLPMIM